MTLIIAAAHCKRARIQGLTVDCLLTWRSSPGSLKAKEKAKANSRKVQAKVPRKAKANNRKVQAKVPRKAKASSRKVQAKVPRKAEAQAKVPRTLFVMCAISVGITLKTAGMQFDRSTSKVSQVHPVWLHQVPRQQQGLLCRRPDRPAGH